MIQTELADAIGRDKDTLSKCERGMSFPNNETLKRLAAVLEKPVSYFFEGAEGTEELSDKRLRREVEVRNILQDLDDDEFERVAKTVKAMVGKD